MTRVGEEGVALALLAAFSRHAVVTCVTLGEGGGEGLIDGAFECFKGVGLLASAGGEQSLTSSLTLPYQELMFTDDEMLDKISGLMQ